MVFTLFDGDRPIRDAVFDGDQSGIRYVGIFGQQDL